ncbi:MAG TPA: hypothetical protein VF334_01385 [Polyangia bacterium]
MKVALLACALVVGGSASADELARAPAARWRVTRGHVEPLADGRARVREPKMRAVVDVASGDEAELRFVYLGPSDGAAPLASGELRRQVGLKLRAENGCNLVYVMWRIEPKPQLVVSVKLNPGRRTHRECGARGYRNLVARAGTPPPPLSLDVEHRLHAKLDGRLLRVWADRALAWEGDVGDEALALRGPAGVRSDNARLELELFVRAATAPLAAAPLSDDED